jgi:hypothetical protein
LAKEGEATGRDTTIVSSDAAAAHDRNVMPSEQGEEVPVLVEELSLGGVPSKLDRGDPNMSIWSCLCNLLLQNTNLGGLGKTK